MKAKGRAESAKRRPARAAESKTRTTKPAQAQMADIPERNRAALALLRELLADESGYQEAVWPKLKQAIEEDRLSYRKRFSD